MHTWGDNNVDWQGINDSAYEIAMFCRRWGRMGGSYKEKFGCVRYYVQFAHSIFSLTHPGYCHYGPYPEWLMKFDIWYGPRVVRYTGLAWFLKHWQPFIYNLAYQRAIKKRPHLRAEILVDADYPELIKGVTRREGKNLHILGWDGEILSTWESM